MKNFARVITLSAFVGACIGSASAATLNLDSYGVLTNSGSPNPTPSGVSNTATLFLGGTYPGGSVPAGSSYNVPTNGIWHAPVDGSNWVSNNPNDYPNGGSFVPNGTYTFTSTFFDATPGTSSGTITVLADDTTSVYLNGTLIVLSSPPMPTGNCDNTVPDCLAPSTFNLSGFIAGTNVLTFAVSQNFGNAMGIDFSAIVNTTPIPEPGSLMLLGTGLIGSAGMFFRRLRA